MEYKVRARIERNGREHDVEMTVGIIESGAFKYGNHKSMYVDYGTGDMLYDIRYDTRYRSNDEAGYIETFIRENLYVTSKVIELHVEPIA